MTQKQPFMMYELFSAKLARRMLTGTIIGLIIISFFIFRVPYPKSEWGELWRVRPLIVTPLAGAMCGACYHMLNSLLYQPGWRKMLAVGIGVVIYIIGLWMGIVLGLVGTLWN